MKLLQKIKNFFLKEKVEEKKIVKKRVVDENPFIIQANQTDRIVRFNNTRNIKDDIFGTISNDDYYARKKREEDDNSFYNGVIVGSSINNDESSSNISDDKSFDFGHGSFSGAGSGSTYDDSSGSSSSYDSSSNDSSSYDSSSDSSSSDSSSSD